MAAGLRAGLGLRAGAHVSRRDTADGSGGYGVHVSRRSGFGLWAALVTCAGFAVRLWYVVVHSWNLTVGGDYIWYRRVAASLAHGGGVFFPFHQQDLPGFRQFIPYGSPSALHAPLFALVLALGDVVGLTTVREQLVENCVLGAGVVAVVAYAGRRIGGDATGVLAGALAAIYPGMWVDDAQGLAEATEVVAVAFVVLCAYRMWARPRPLRAVLLGVAVGCATLARAEEIVLLPLVAWVVVLRMRRTWRERLTLAGVSTAAAVALIAPWAVRNLVTFPRTEVISSQLGITLVSANCGSTYDRSSMFFGYWDLQCFPKHDPKLPHEESAADHYLQHVAFTYARRHAGRLPEVALARMGRMWYVFRPFEQARLNGNEGWSHGAAIAAVWSSWALTPFAGAGLVILWRRKVPVAPLLAPIALMCAVAVLVYGNSRYRADAELSLVLGAAALVTALLGRLRTPAPPLHEVPGDPATASAVPDADA